MHSTPIFCGIDFGTSNSAVATVIDDDLVLCRLEHDQPTIPSAIFFDFEERQTRFGREAIELYADGVQGRLLRSLKSILGTSLIDEQTQIHGERVAFRDVLSMFFAHLKQRAENAVGSPIEHIVLGRPVRFSDDDDEADRRAQDELIRLAHAQGFKQVELQLEPVAAAMAYEESLTTEQLALVVDLGGGTSDFAIVRLSPERRNDPDRGRDILACAGVHIGGTDIDRDMSLGYAMQPLGVAARVGPKKLPMPRSVYVDLATWHRIPLLYDRRTLNELRQLRIQVEHREGIDRLIELVTERRGHRLAGAVEQAKIDLSDHNPAMIHLPLNESFDVSVTTADLDVIVMPSAKKIAATIDHCCRDAGVTTDQIDTVFFTGGTSLIPRIRQHIGGLLGAARLVDGDVFGSVCIGLGIDAQRRFGSR